MAIVFKTPKSTLNTTSKAIQNLGGDCPPCPEPVLEGKELNYTQNGEYTVTPEQGVDGFSSIDVTVNVPSDVNNQNKSVNPSTSSQTVEADSGYSGLGTVTVNAVTAAIDPNIQAANILSGVTILGVAGTDEGYDAGYAQGEYDQKAKLVSLSVSSNGTFEREDGYSAIVVNVTPDLQAKTVNPSTSQQTVTPDQGRDGLSSVTVNAVTAAIDANIQAENILNGVEILGVTGENLGYDQGYADGYAQGQSECPEPGGCDHTAYVQETITTNGTYTYDPSDYQGDSYDAFDGVEITVNVPSGGTNVPDWSSIGWTSQDVTDSGLTADVAYTATVKDNNSWSNDPNLVFAPKQSNESGGVFQNCSQLAFVPDFTFTGTNVSYRNAFNNCPSLESIGSISCPNVTSSRDADSMFSGCTHLTYIKNIDMKNCRRGSNMFSACWALKDVSFTNMEQIEDIATLFTNTAYITTIRSMSGLGKGFVDISSSATYSGLEHTLDLSAQQYGLTKQSIMTVINDIVAPDDTNVNDATLKLSAASYALLDASDIAIATAKNWSVVSA